MLPQHIYQYIREQAQQLRKETENIDDAMNYIGDIINDTMNEYDLDEHQRKSVRDAAENAIRSA